MGKWNLVGQPFRVAVNFETQISVIRNSIIPESLEVAMAHKASEDSGIKIGFFVESTISSLEPSGALSAVVGWRDSIMMEFLISKISHSKSSATLNSC